MHVEGDGLVSRVRIFPTHFLFPFFQRNLFQPELDRSRGKNMGNAVFHSVLN